MAKYNSFIISKNEEGRYEIYDVFGERSTNHTYKSPKEAKGVIDNVLIPQNKQKRFMPIHYSQYWWAVMDKTTQLYHKKEDGKLLLFKRREDCFKWCEEHNNLLS